MRRARRRRASRERASFPPCPAARTPTLAPALILNHLALSRPLSLSHPVARPRLQPLWLSLRGMVGSNLFADGIWPITSNDGHLSVVKFRRDDRQRFWFIDPAQTDALSLAGVFAAWAKTLVTGLRLDVAQLGACLQVRRKRC